MAKGSQLTQLKSALADAGLSRKNTATSSAKKRKRTKSAIVPVEKDKQKAEQKLREIHERLNPFDTKITKLKHDVGGRKLKGVVGKPGQSKQAGLEQRKKTLLVELERKDHVGGIVDRRFGEYDPTMTPEERMLERFTRERQRSSKGAIYNLEEEDDLTHYGRSLSLVDDFDGTGLALENDEEEEGNGQIDKKTVARGHFGGFSDNEEDEEDGPPRKKSKAEVMAEVIAKSKEHKYQRQLDKEATDKARMQVDEEFDNIRSLVFADSAQTKTANANLDVRDNTTAADANMNPLAHESLDGDQQYDQLVRELAFDKRAKPKDRTKTEEEIAAEEKEALEEAERARLRRMLGEESEDDDSPNNHRRKRPRGGDDLEDDFGEELSSTNVIGLGLGEKDDDASATGEEEEEGEGEDDDEAEEGSEGDDTEEDEGEWGGLEEASVSLIKQREKKPSTPGNKELPFTFPCPASHDEFLSILDGIEDRHLGTVVQRIRALYHPSLDKDNPRKLQVFLEVLIDHVLDIASPPTPKLPLIDVIFPHIYALAKIYPVTAANACLSKLILMHKNLARGLSQGASLEQARTWPGTAELSLLRLLGKLWSSSDMNHAVISPARILIGSYLSLARIRSIKDIASGSFLCTILLQYEELSKRFCPEAFNFLLNALLSLAPHPFRDPKSCPGGFPLPDFNANKTLQFCGKDIRGCTVMKPRLVSIMLGDMAGSASVRLGLFDMILQLLEKFVNLNKGLDGFIELHTSTLQIITKLDLDGCPSPLQDRRLRLQDYILKLLQASQSSRRPLLLQTHKPIPIPSIIPKFTATTSNYLRNKDPDAERAAASKLRRQVKEERKGAIRELRKDARFLASVQQKREVEEAENYNSRMKKVFSSIEQERSEQKTMEREKKREKRRGKSK